MEPVSAFNLDFLGEHYFGNVGVISGGLFYKRLNNFIYNSSFRTNNLNGRPFGEEVIVFQAINGDQANLFGFELAYQQNLNFLPGFLRGFGIYGNYTYTNSSAEISTLDEDGNLLEETIDLPGQATHMGNLSLSYNLGRFNARISGNFNGEYLSEIDEGFEIYVKDRLQIDLNASYNILSNLQFFAEFINLTDQPFEVYQEREDVVIQREFYSWWSRIGLKFDL